MSEETKPAKLIKYPNGRLELVAKIQLREWDRIESLVRERTLGHHSTMEEQQEWLELYAAVESIVGYFWENKDIPISMPRKVLEIN